MMAMSFARVTGVRATMSRLRNLDGFQLFSGILAVVAAPIMLVLGAPAGWSFLILAIGVVVLLTQWMIATDVAFDAPDVPTLVLGVLGVACIGIAVVYLTRPANDLPSIFFGYDHDSEDFQLVPGALTLFVGAVAVGRAIASVHPARRAHR
jgi:hypothetical protein